MNDNDLLYRRYRRLLWAYPSWYRRERGLEMLTTLLDAARPGQHRPTFREIVDVVGTGLWCRVRPPRPGYALLFLPVALFVALTGSVVVVRLTFAVLAPMPTEDDAITMAEAAVGQRPHNVPGPVTSCAPTCPVHWSPTEDAVLVLDTPFDTNEGVDAAIAGYWPPPDQRAAMVARAGARLAAQGWTVHHETGGTGSAVIAVRDGWKLQVVQGLPQPLYSAMYEYPPLFVTVQRLHPTPAARLSTWAFAAGLPAGWLVTNWVVGCYRRHRTGRQTAILLFGATAIVFAVLTDVIMTWFNVLHLLYVPRNIRGPGALLPAAQPVTILLVPGVLAGLVSVVLAGLPGRSATQRIALGSSPDRPTPAPGPG